MILSGSSDFKFLSYDILYKIDDFVLSLKHKSHFGLNDMSNFNPTLRDNYDFVISIEKNQRSIVVGNSGDKMIRDFFWHLVNDGIIEPKNATEDFYTNIFYPSVYNSIMANYALELKKDYSCILSSDGIQIDILDQSTGRNLEGQRFSGGLHQAIQVKESKKIINNPKYSQEEKTRARKIGGLKANKGFITFPNFLSLYNKFSGMSGTLMESHEKLKKLYGVDIIDIESHKASKRIDNNLETFETSRDKLKRIFELVEYHHKNKQPILIGTINIKDSIFIAEELRARGYSVEVLNADTKLEHEIIKNAGKTGSIVVATNMAGRGTDIKLDEVSREHGGLCVIGTSLNQSVRCDNQLRGRAGRQGDPGVTYLLSSLEDDIYKGWDYYMASEFNSKEALKLQSKIEDHKFSELLAHQKFYYYIDCVRKTYYKIRNGVLEKEDPIEILNLMNEITKDEEIQHYIEILSETLENPYIKGLKKSISNRLTALLPKLDNIWGDFLEKLPNLMNQVALSSTYNKSDSNIDINIISDSLKLLIETILNEILKIVSETE